MMSLVSVTRAFRVYFANDGPGLQAVVSPSSCSVMQIRNDGIVKWKQLDYHVGDIGSSMEDRTSSLHPKEDCRG